MELSPLKESLIAAGFLQDDTSTLPPLVKTRVVIPAAKVATLFSAPVELVPAIVGKAIVPEWLHVYKPAGTAWTTAGSGLLFVGWTGSVAKTFGIADQNSTTDFFGADADVWIASGGKGNLFGLGNLKGVNGIYSTNVVLGLVSADITVGTTGLAVTIWWRAWGEPTP